MFFVQSINFKDLFLKNDEFNIVIIFLLFILSYLLTYLVIHYTQKHKILDIPNDRSSHTVPTPRGGGLAIVICWYIGLIYLYLSRAIEIKLFYSMLPGILIAIISLLDDLLQIKPAIRLLVQLIAVTISLIILKGMEAIDFSFFEIMPSFVLNILTIMGAVWYINLYNFLDGIDGYASLEAISVALIIFLFTGNWVLLMFIASVTGFLIWNWPRAKIFMGDIGSTQLGFVIVILGVYFHNSGRLSIIQWIMVTSLFWFDATHTLIRRWRNKEKLTVAHKKHVYQRAVQSGLSHQKTIILSLLINLVIFGMALLTAMFNYLLLPLLLLNIFLLYGLTKIIDRRVPFLS